MEDNIDSNPQFVNAANPMGRVGLRVALDWNCNQLRLAFMPEPLSVRHCLTSLATLVKVNRTWEHINITPKEFRRRLGILLK